MVRGPSDRLERSRDAGEEELAAAAAELPRTAAAAGTARTTATTTAGAYHLLTLSSTCLRLISAVLKPLYYH
jgi:hypothetical protein